MFEIVLSEGSEVASLLERPVLPSIQQRNLQKFEPFPAKSESLLDLPLFEQSLDVPRFSLFSGEDIELNGFRLMHKDGTFFHDASLVHSGPEVTADFLAKCRSGQSEDIDASFMHDPDPSRLVVDEDVLVLSSDEPSNFGSWIYRFLPKLLLSEPYAGELPLFCYVNSWIAPILDFVVPGRKVIAHNPRHRYHLRRPLIPSLPAPHVLFRPEIIEAMQKLADRVPNRASGMEKIYVSRRKQALSRIGHRVFENETQLVETLAERGFQEFFPEDHTFEEQISIFAGAREIVGCGGSNMFGCVFARSAEFIVDIESTTDWAFAHSNLLSSVKSPYAMVRGVPTTRGNSFHRNWIVDTDEFVRGLERRVALRAGRDPSPDLSGTLSEIPRADIQGGSVPNFLFEDSSQ